MTADFNDIAVQASMDIDSMPDPIIQTEVDLLCILADYPEESDKIKSVISCDMITDSKIGKILKNYLFENVPISRSVIEQELNDPAYCINRSRINSSEVPHILKSICHNFKIRYITQKFPLKVMKSKSLSDVGSIIEKAQQVLNRGIVKTTAFDKQIYLKEFWDYQTEKHACYSTGIHNIDSHLVGGLQTTRITCVSGEPGTGKTMLCLNIMRQLAEYHKEKCAFFTLEMPRVDIFNRLLSIFHPNIHSDEILSRSIDEIEYHEELESIAKMPFILIDDIYSYYDIISNIRELASSGYKFFFVDFLQLIQFPNTSMSQVQCYEYVMTEFKKLCKHYKISIVLVSQFKTKDDIKTGMSGQIIKRDPTMSDLKGTSAISQCSDLILLLTINQEERFSFKEDINIKLICDKNKYGPIFRTYLNHNRNNGIFSDGNSPQEQDEIDQNIKEQLHNDTES